MPDQVKQSLSVQRLGRIGFGEAYAMQRQLVDQRKQGLIPDQFLLLEHPHTVTMGRNGHEENVLASPEVLERTGIAYHQTDRGGDVTYHGPGQIIGYAIIDLKDWKRDVMAYVRALEEVLIRSLAEFGIAGERLEGCTGVWVGGKKVAAIGVHISRWVTNHGFALNLDTDLKYFQYIVPCGLTKPVTSLRELGCSASRDSVENSLIRHMSEIFSLTPVEPVLTLETA